MATDRNKRGPITPSQRRQAVKEKFLLWYSITHCVRKAARRCGIHWDTFYEWRAKGYLTDEEMWEAEERFFATVRGELRMARYIDDPFHPQEPIIENGRVCASVKDPFEHASRTYILRLAGAHLPEFQPHR